ncbi:MAG: histidine kinase, partial [Deltaproteobacteria bacterium]|nr:histidine kinase [Deltaproteobacteria bacterium]
MNHTVNTHLNPPAPLWRRLFPPDRELMYWVLYLCLLCESVNTLFFYRAPDFPIGSRLIVIGSWFLVILVATLFCSSTKDASENFAIGWIPPIIMGVIILVAQYIFLDAPQTIILHLTVVVFAAELSLRKALTSSFCLLGALMAIHFIVIDPSNKNPLTWSIGAIGLFCLGRGFAEDRAKTIQFRAERLRAEELTAEIDEANAAFVTAKKTETALAVSEEQASLAREIHDGLGHYLTVLHVQLQAAEKLLTLDPGRAREVIDVCLEQADAGVREVQKTFAEEDFSPLLGLSLAQSIEKLIKDAAVDPSIKVILEFRGKIG